MRGDFDLEGLRAWNQGYRPRLIGFCGPAGCGKTFAATHLAASFGYSRVRFAGPLKAMCKALGMTDAEIDGPAKEQSCDLLGGRTPRWAMQTLGTEWGRDLIDPDLWVRAWERQALSFLDAGDPVVVDDVRFANEAAAIWQRGGVLIRLDRAGAGRSAGEGHASERLDFPYDARLENYGDRAFLVSLAALVRRAC